MGLPSLVKNRCKNSRNMWERGWAEANGGNISLRLDAEQRKVVDFFKARNDWQKMPEAFPSLGGEYFMVTATGSYLRNIELAQSKAWASSRFPRTATPGASSGASSRTGGRPRSWCPTWGRTWR